MKTNIERLTELMSYSKHGALMQGFVMAAIEEYSRAILNSDKPENWPEMLSWDAWHGCAEEAVEKLNHKVIDHG